MAVISDKLHLADSSTQAAMRKFTTGSTYSPSYWGIRVDTGCVKQKTALLGGFLESRSSDLALVALDLGAHLVDEFRSRLLSAEAEREPECEREGDNDALEERLDQRASDIELEKRHENGEDPYSPLRDGADEVRRTESRRHRRSDDEPPDSGCDDDADDKDEGGNDNLREIGQHDIAEEIKSEE